MTARSSSPAKPHSRTKADREQSIVATIDPDKEWSDGIWRVLLDSCHPFQRLAVSDPAKRYAWLIARGGAKTTSFRARGVRVLTNKARAKVLYFATTRQRAKDLMWFPLKALLHKLGFVVDRDVTFNETELRCTIHRTGSMYQLSGLQDVADADKWRGDTFDEVQFDECGALKPELVEYTVYQVIGPRVHCLGLGGTPGLNRRKLFYDVTRPGGDMHRPYSDRDKEEYVNWNGFSSHHWDLEDISKLPDAESLYPELCRLWQEALEEKERNKWSDDNPIWLREYRAVWSGDNTLRVFGSFQPHNQDGSPRNIWDPSNGRGLVGGVSGLQTAVKQLHKAYPEFTDWRYVVPMDMGHKDPFACSVFGFSPHDPLRRKWQLMDFERVGMHAKPIAELLIGADELDAFIKTGVYPTKYGGVFGAIGGWPDGMVMDSDHATIEELKKVYGIQVEKADKKPEYKGGAIELANGELSDSRFFVLLGSAMQSQLEQLQWKENESGRLIEDPAQANHSSDLVVYGLRKIANMFASGQVEQDDKQVTASAYQDPMGIGPPSFTDQQSDEEPLPMAGEWSDADDDW